MASNFNNLNLQEDPYKILGINKNVTESEIKKAYYQKAKIYHPDKNVDNGDDIKALSNARIRELTSAYKLLINDRAKADEISEKGHENDTYRGDGIRVNSGYLILNKRFSDKFRTNEFKKDDPLSSKLLSLDDDLNLWSDERFDKYKKIGIKQ